MFVSANLVAIPSDFKPTQRVLTPMSGTTALKYSVLKIQLSGEK